MPRSVSGVYTLPAGNPVVTGTPISSTWANSTLADIAQELTNSIDRGGRSTATANLPMGGFRHTGAGAATGAGQYLVWGQANGQLSSLTVDGGAGTGMINAPIMLLATGGLERMRITSSGTVGIGTDPGAVFHVRAAAAELRAQSTGDLTAGGTAFVRFLGSGAGNSFVGHSGGSSQFEVYNGLNGALALSTNAVERMRITAGGDIGIGTASPVSAFDVRRAGGGTVVVSTDASRYGFIQWSDVASRFRVATDGNFPITFDTNGAERLRVAPDGTIRFPGSLLATGTGAGQVTATFATGLTDTNFRLWTYNGQAGSDPGTAQANLMLGYEGQSLNTAGFSFMRGIGATDSAIAIWAGNAERMRVDSAGRLGVGVTPAEWLHVRSPNASTWMLLQTSTDAGVYVGNNGGAAAFLTSGVERLRISASGDVGIGTTSPAVPLHIRGAGPELRLETTGNLAAGAAAFVRFVGSNGFVGSMGYGGIAGRLDIVNSMSGGITFFSGGASAGDERLRITAAGQMQQRWSDTSFAPGLSLTNPSAASGSTGQIFMDAGDVGTGLRVGIHASGNPVTPNWVFVNQERNAPLALLTNNTDRVVIDGVGRVMTNATAPGAGLVPVGAADARFTVVDVDFPAAVFVGQNQPTRPPVAVWHRDAGSNPTLINFYTDGAPGTVRGNILFNRGSGLIQYNTSSDARLKDNIDDAPEAGDIIDAIKVRSFTWKETGYLMRYGFVAQELEAVAPEAVSVGDDGEEVETPWAVDYSKLVPLLVREVQSLRQRVTRLETVQ